MLLFIVVQLKCGLLPNIAFVNENIFIPVLKKKIKILIGSVFEELIMKVVLERQICM